MDINDLMSWSYLEYHGAGLSLDIGFVVNFGHVVIFKLNYCICVVVIGIEWFMMDIIMYVLGILNEYMMVEYMKFFGLKLEIEDVNEWNLFMRHE